MGLSLSSSAEKCKGRYSERTFWILFATFFFLIAGSFAVFFYAASKAVRIHLFLLVLVAAVSR